MYLPRSRVRRLGCILLAVAFASLATQSHAQEPPPKHYTDEEKTGLDHNNVKLDNLIIPAVKLEQVSFTEALGRIRTLAEENDHDVEPGINLFLKHSLTSQARLKDALITLDLQAVPLRKVLEALAKQADLDLEVEPWAVALRARR